jgi:S-adenosylmethionine synthetase
MPAPIQYAHAITRQLAYVRKTGEISWLRPDGKSQVTVEYEDGRPLRIHTVVVSAHHSEDVEHSEITNTLIEKVITPVLPKTLVDDDCVFHINPTGRFVTGGPHGDAGLTGRKIIVDTYGGLGRHGGGAFSGKDPTKVDRSAAYAARWAAKNVVAAGLSTQCEIQLAYAIGVAEPVSVLVTDLRDAQVSEYELARAVSKVFDFTPSGIIDRLGLRAPIYTSTAAYGHFGRTPEKRIPEAGGGEAQFFPWELTDRAEDLKNALGS